MEEKLYMPSNISTEDCIFGGVGKQEMKYLIILSSIGIILGVVVGIIFSFQVGIMFVALSFVVSYFFVMKNPNDNNSTMKSVRNIYLYLTNQNMYKYEYKEWWWYFEENEENERTNIK